MSTLTEDHKTLLAAGAIPVEVAEAAGAFSVTTRDGLPVELRDGWAGAGIVFVHHRLDGSMVPQYRPDRPHTDADGRACKYLFPKGCGSPLNVVPAMVDRLDTASTLLIVEGTKQTLAAVAYAPDEVAVAGISGCNGAELEQVAALPIDGVDVVVAFDADVATNHDVHAAAKRLAEQLDVLGAAKVRFLSIPATTNTGLDDFLAKLAGPDARRRAFARLIDNASAKLPARPARKRTSVGVGGEFFDSNGLKVLDVAAAIRAAGDYAVAPDGSIWQYVGGRYVDNDPLVGAVRDLLGNRYRPLHRKAVDEILVDDLRRAGLVLGDEDTPGLVNVTNGMLRVATGDLEPHDPAHLSVSQLPVAWNPSAICPEFDAWIVDRCGHQADDILEAAGLMLCPWVRQRRTVFLFGPTRSGKGVFLRLLEGIAGTNTAAVTLHQLGTNRFSAASLYGKLLNVAGDLSDHHIDDLSIYKTLTGDDLVAGERKFRDPFTFRNKALFVFSANNPPTVAETSRAYLARIRPFLFPHSVEGREDAELDNRLAAELPGILVRLVEGAQRWLARGGYAPGDPMVADEFAQQSDVAALFAAQVINTNPGGFTTGKEMFDAYSEWATANGRGRLGRNKFLARLESTLGSRERRRGDRTGPTGWRNVRLLGSDEWIESDPLARFARFLTTSPHEEIGEGEEENPREGKVGPDRANRARTEPVADDPLDWTDTAGDDPDQLVEVEF